MTYDEMVESVACEVCGKTPKLPPDECYRSMGRNRPLCNEHDKCRIFEKSEEQLIYVLSPIQNLFLRAYPGCGKTEVVGLKAAYEIQRWNKKPGGIAVITFTKNATEVINQRVNQFAGIDKTSYPHFIGTIDSWLHGYIAHPFGYVLTKYEGKDGDYSIRVIDTSSSAGFLNSFITTYKFGMTRNVLANQFYFDLETKRFIFNSGDQKMDSARKSIRLLDWQIRDLQETKRRFLKGGFATYQDIEYLCYLILSGNTEFAKMLSKRFPFIIVDECQDLSWIQLQILSILKGEGTILNFIGDLNQAIFEFKEVDPQKLADFVTHEAFAELSLTSNYRSCQPIVDLCQQIVKGPIVNGEQAASLKQPCICVFYNATGMSELTAWFEEYLNQFFIDINKSAIITRNWKNVSRLRPSGHRDIDSHQKRLAMAIHLWENGNIQSIHDSLRYLGRFFADKYFNNYSSNSQHYDCPECVSSPMKWRIFLSHVLNLCIKNDSIRDLGQPWSAWVLCIRNQFSALAKFCFPILEDTLTEPIPPFGDLDGKSFQVPRNLGTDPVEQSLLPGNVKSSAVRITTIHSVKGQTYEAVLVVSAPNKQGTNDGHWTQWLENPKSEAARLSYVASSRPRQLLTWAIPQPTQEEKKQLEALGFYILEET
jgi:DNA helicase-2/ATP-dependent DNA helicase PcrA